MSFPILAGKKEERGFKPLWKGIKHMLGMKTVPHLIPGKHQLKSSRLQVPRPPLVRDMGGPWPIRVGNTGLDRLMA